MLEGERAEAARDGVQVRGWIARDGDGIEAPGELGQDVGGDEPDEGVAVADVLVQRRGADPHRRRHALHRQRLDAVRIEDLPAGADDRRRARCGEEWAWGSRVAAGTMAIDSSDDGYVE